METMNIIILLLRIGQSVSTNEWPCHMEAPLVCNMRGAHLIGHKMSPGPFGSFAIRNQHIRHYPRQQRTNPTNVAGIVNGSRFVVYIPGTL